MSDYVLPSNCPRIMVGGPVRDREWSVPLWLGGLLELDYPREKLTLAVLVNDSTDATLEACEWWGARAADAGFGRVVVCDTSFGTVVDNNERRRTRDYAAFASARDAWVRLRDNEEYLLQVDSDVQCPPELLRDLVCLALTHDTQALAAVIDNSLGGTPEWFRNVLQCTESGGYRHDVEAHELRQGVYPCALTGALILLHRGIFDQGLTYRDGLGDLPGDSEDSAFCRSLLAAGITPHYAPAVRAMHWMKPPLDLRYLRSLAWHQRLADYHADRALALNLEAHGG